MTTWAMARYPYNTAAWRKVRDHVLERDGHVCRLGLHCCTVVATTVDHVVPVSLLDAHDPALLDPTNLVAACQPCNSAKRDRVAPTPTRRHRRSQRTSSSKRTARANDASRTRDPGTPATRSTRPPHRRSHADSSHPTPTTEGGSTPQPRAVTPLDRTTRNW